LLVTLLIIIVNSF